MTQLIHRAFEKAMELPEEEQNRFARFLLTELESDQQWSDLLANPESDALLERLADEALLEHHSGQTRPLSMDDL